MDGGMEGWKLNSFRKVKNNKKRKSDFTAEQMGGLME